MQCASGYYANQAQCLSCSSNCIACINSATCISCASEYKLSTGECVLCGINYCLACSDDGSLCYKCMPSTTNTSANTCTPCSFPCVTCLSSISTCTSCEVGYYLSGTSCLKCVGCSRCNPLTGICLACPVGQYLNGSNLCTFCLNTTSNCAICSGSTCQVCERNYYWTGTSCALTATISSCIIYQKDSTTLCEHCIPGFYLNSVNYSCLKCPN